jgi:hypothetical protein
MRIEVEESGIAQWAASGEAAASAVATIELHGVATAVTHAMPGSRAAGEAMRAAPALADAAQVLAASLAEHAESLRGAVRRYADTEDQVLARGRGAAGAA